jgi:hypothetical protein
VLYRAIQLQSSDCTSKQKFARFERHQDLSDVPLVPFAPGPSRGQLSRMLSALKVTLFFACSICVAGRPSVGIAKRRSRARDFIFPQSEQIQHFRLNCARAREKGHHSAAGEPQHNGPCEMTNPGATIKAKFVESND